MLKIGPYQLASRIVLAPMAGITDLPFRDAVNSFGAGMTVAEMVSAKPQLLNSSKSTLRRVSLQESLPRAIQIVGNDPKQMAQAAQHNVSRGAGLIDINMGCPAKKVFRKAAGSALLADELMVRRILDAVVESVDVPVTLKIRTGIDKQSNNAVKIAMIAQNAGIQALTVHGRSKACLFRGQAEYETVRAVKAAVEIPVIANGDITTPQKAHYVLAITGADGVMIGRAAQGNPWLLAMIDMYVEAPDSRLSKLTIHKPSIERQMQACIEHIRAIHAHYGVEQGVRIARKHIRWYLSSFDDGVNISKLINQLNKPSEVIRMIEEFYFQKSHQRVAA